MDDHEAMIGLVGQERIADPAQVGLALERQIDQRSDAGVDEQIVAEPHRVGKAGQEFPMGGRERRVQLGQRGGFAEAVERDRIEPVAAQALAAAELEPMPHQPALPGEQAQQHFLVIAGDERGLDARAGVGAQALDNLVRGRAAVDQVAEKDEQRAGWPARVIIAFDIGQQAVEQVDAAVDVADGIAAPASRRAGHPVLHRFHPTEHRPFQPGLRGGNALSTSRYAATTSVSLYRS